EMAHHAEQVHDTDLTVTAKYWCVLNLGERGDLSAAQEAHRTVERFLDTLRDPLHRWWRERDRASMSVQEGHFASAEQQIQECLKLEQLLNAGPPFAFLAQISELYLAQGRRLAVEAMAGVMDNAVTPLPERAQRCLVAFVARELERGAEARAEFENL